MSSTVNNANTVPAELRDILFDFAITYLLEQPSNIVDYGVEYFDKLKKTKRLNATIKQSSVIGSDDDDDDGGGGGGGVSGDGGGGDDNDMSNDESLTSSCYGQYSRRQSIVTESYHLNEDETGDWSTVVFYKSDAQRQALADIVKHIFLFRALDQEQINYVIDAMFEQIVRAGDVIIRQGDAGDNFYVIDGGVFETYVTDGDGNDCLVNTHENKGSFGELALLYNTPRAVTVKATTDGRLWVVDRRLFKRVVVKSAYKKRAAYKELIESVPALRSLRLYEQLNLADALVPKYYHGDQRVIRQGEQVDGIYFVEKGAVAVFVNDETGKPTKTREIGKGGYFGELPLVNQKRHAASVFAVGNVKLAYLNVDAFERLLGPCTDIIKRNMDDNDDDDDDDDNIWSSEMLNSK